ncbi:MAG: cytochrome P450 [Rhizobiaceae bacterium]|nr:cytochrome P450 [Rhizobiaceae bacterium]
MRKNPLSTYSQYHYEWPILAVKTILGTIAVINDADAIRRVLVQNHENYVRDSFQQRMLAPMVANSLLTAEGASWRRQRRSMAPLFSAQKVASFVPAMANAAAAMVTALKRHEDGKVVDGPREMARAAVGILDQTIFGDGIGADHGEVSRILDKFIDQMGQIDFADAFGMPEWVPRLSMWRTRKQRRFFPIFSEMILNARRARPREGGEPDIVSILLSRDPETGQRLFTDAEIQGNLVLFLTAGFESTANTLTWVAHLLSIDPVWREQVEAEADREMPDGRFPEDGIGRFPVARAVVEEALRLYPPVASIHRQAVGPDELCGQDIAPGTLVCVSTWLLHRHRSLWTDPEAFDPSRFMPGAREAIDRYAYMPFGFGPRTCIGASFALNEAIVIVASLARHFRLEAVPGHTVVPLQRVTLHQGNGLPLRLRHRHPA